MKQQEGISAGAAHSIQLSYVEVVLVVSLPASLSVVVMVVVLSWQELGSKRE